MITHTILVVCDNPRHARGKIAKIAFYHRHGDKWTRQGGNRPRAWARRGDRVSAAGFKPDIIDVLGPDLMPQKCKLCGERVRSYVDDVLFPILNQLAAHGESQISMRKLNLLASKLQEG
jgi:hypothetical protein